MASSFSSFEPLLTYLSELNQWQAQKQFSRPRIIKKLETESDYQIQIYKEYGDFSSYEFCVLKPARAYKSLVQLLVELREDHFKKVFQFNSNDIDIHSIHWEYYEDENILVLNIPKKQDLCYNLMDFTLPGFFNFGGPFVGQTAIFNSPQRKQSHIFTELEDDLIRAQYQKEAEEAAQVARWKQEEPAIRAQYQKEAEEAALIGRLKQAEAADNEMARKVAEDEAKQQDELDNKELQRLEREGQIRAQKEYERAKKEAANRAKQRAEAQKRRKELREMNKARQEEEQKRREEHDKLVEQQQKFLQNLLSNMYADPLLELRKEQKEREKVPRSSSKDGNTKKQQQERAAELQPEPLDGDDDEGEDVSMSEPGAEKSEKKKEEQISSRSSSSSKATYHPTIEDVDDDEYVVFRKKFGSN
ncbi:uncharacterized protein KQ657_000775 [Scheffersomyces spartinae]|uniref:Uncharacterized protein n=1 Tax=Scheffersomyces spartinae TaxID=45513 RepID=A0A9P7V9K3_9ASCO|nr:uncharacterized protein KQ657_000775 [Scheffersomyces spartinae]KAG7193358.1 hypothetical protein KQ657_000775 [Scheffersomyces spartinae]